MNMILHDFPTANILSGNTLAAPKFLDGQQLRTYDYVVANPPFSDKAWSTGLTPANDPYQRFTWGEPPTKQGDYAYLLHIVRSMKSTGKAACILPHGVLFRGNAEAVIRKQLVSSGILKGIIGLPANLFYGTGIPACILVLDKENAAARKGVMMIDASKGFIKDGNKNRLREQDIHRMVDAFRKGEEVTGYARLVPLAEMASDKNDFNLNLPRYIDSSEPEDIQDLTAHLQGGIPHRDLDALGAYWQVMPSLRATLFAPLRPGYSQLQQPIAELKAAILGHAEFTAFLTTATTLFDDWRARHTPRLMAFQKGDHPKELVEALAEDLLASFKAAPLVDEYAVYQQLMDYWAEAMQDDAYLIALDGWVAQPRRVVETDKKGKQKDKGWACDPLPKPYVVARYFAAEQAALDAKQAALDAVSSQLAELEEEHSGDEAAFAAFDKVNAASVKERIKEIGANPDSADELQVLKAWLKLATEEAALKKAVKDMDAALDQQAHDQYARLSVLEIQMLVIHDKWLARLGQDLQAELDRVSQALTRRIRELAERYAVPLPQLADDVEALSGRVEVHLQRMGVAWK
jgi:type I restriction enzyme M protein